MTLCVICGKEIENPRRRQSAHDGDCFVVHRQNQLRAYNKTRKEEFAEWKDTPNSSEESYRIVSSSDDWGDCSEFYSSDITFMLKYASFSEGTVLNGNGRNYIVVGEQSPSPFTKNPKHQSLKEIEFMKKVIVYGTKACSPCNTLKAAMEKEGVPFEYVDVEKEPVDFNVERLPTTLIFKNEFKTGDPEIILGNAFKSVKEAFYAV